MTIGGHGTGCDLDEASIRELARNSIDSSFATDEHKQGWLADLA